ncbi:hypothetical protein ACIRJM_23005 [Streptomyces sp. NPDC102405]|uniref:hypothetical protein n=1 Tax=Streptomyces sp. NPDC102405 TaxID=3366170 RepID=UPI00380E9CE2
MSPFIFDADLATTELGTLRRRSMTVSDANDDHIVGLFAEYRDALAADDSGLVNLIRDHAYAIDPSLLAELDGFDYPAAA